MSMYEKSSNYKENLFLKSNIMKNFLAILKDKKDAN